MKYNLFYSFLFLTNVLLFAQNQTDSKTKQINVVVEDTISKKQLYDPLAPARAAFYSAVLPGLGQMSNRKYWKIPIIYAGIATGVYFYVKNDTDYNRFRDAYKRRLAGYTDDEFFGPGSTPLISNNRLIDAQKSTQRNKNVSIIVSIGFYLLNIIDANVDAHLKHYDISDDLSLTPKLNTSDIAQPSYGLSLRYTLK
ncbi:DUF5683 domain-containing protein [Flavobacteriaceae bacterium]|nr:DUF5683 domain-containing protein [Flavobacteriaceae bacterium]